MIYRAQKNKQNSLYYLIHVDLCTPSSPSRNSVHDWSSDTSIGKHVHICIMYLMSIKSSCRSRPSDTVYNSAEFDHTTGVSEKTLTSMQDTVRMLQEQIGKMYSPSYLYLDWCPSEINKTFIFQQRQNSSWQASHHSNPQTPTNTIRVMAKRISHSFNSNPQTPTNLLKPKAPSSSSFHRDPPAPFITDHQRDPTSPFVTDYLRDPLLLTTRGTHPHPLSLATRGTQPHPLSLTTRGTQPHPLLLTTRGTQHHPLTLTTSGTQPHPLSQTAYQRDRSSLPSSVAASFGAKEPPAGDGMTSPLLVATDKSTRKSLSSSAIKKDKLQSVAAVLEQHHRLKGEKNAGSLTIKLAKDALFGDEVLKLCTPMGNRSLSALPTKELQQLKAIISSVCKLPQ